MSRLSARQAPFFKSSLTIPAFPLEQACHPDYSEIFTIISSRRFLLGEGRKSDPTLLECHDDMESTMTLS